MSGPSERTRFDAGLVGAFVAGAVGLLAGSVTVSLVAGVALAFVAYGHVSGAPEGEVATERVVSDDSPHPGEPLDVSLTVANVGSTPLPDLRIGDRVPDDLPVLDGSPATCTSLGPGEEVTVSYTVRARRGTVTFDDPIVVARRASGGEPRQLATDATTTLTCRTHVEEVGLASETALYTGRVETDAGGEGVEFYATREYQHGDPLPRIDWNRYASTDELRTIDFRETRAATVVVIIDTSQSADTAAGAEHPSALELSEYAAENLAEALLDNHNRVGVARYTVSCRYLSPGAGHDQTVRVRRFLDGDFGDSELIRDDVLAEFRKRLPSEAQMLYCSPFLDDHVTDFVERLTAYGYPVTVVSPDVTTGDTVADTVERVERSARLGEVRGRHVRTVDWSPAEPLEAALDRAEHRWSR